MKYTPIEMNDISTGVIRTKIVCLIDCPKCHTSMKLIEQIKDDGTVKGELLVKGN